MKKMCSHQNSCVSYSMDGVCKTLWKVFFFFCCLVAKSCLTLTSWTVDHQAPLSMGFPRQEYWTDLPCPSPDPGIKPVSPESPVLAAGFFTTEPPWKVCWDLNSGNPLCWNFNLKSFSRSTVYYSFHENNLLPCNCLYNLITSGFQVFLNFATRLSFLK